MLDRVICSTFEARTKMTSHMFPHLYSNDLDDIHVYASQKVNNRSIACATDASKHGYPKKHHSRFIADFAD